MADALLASLASTGPLIENFGTNLLKTGKVKRTAMWLKSRQMLLESYWAKYQDLHHSLAKIADETVKDYAYFTDDVYSTMENCYVEALSVILTELEELTPTSSRHINAPFRDSTGSQAPTNASYNSLLPLPKVPEFGGNYMDWPSFKDIFEAMVHNDAGLSTVRKLYCLKLFLKDDAASLVKNVSVTGENYTVAWNALKAKYDNTRLICTTYLQKLASLSHASDTAKSLKALLNGTTETVQALNQLGRPVNHWDDWLVYITVTKLDVNSRQEWEASISGSSRMVEFQTLTTWLENRVRALEAMEMAKPKSQPKYVKAHAGITSSGCAECHKDHFLGSCFIFRRKSVQHRRNLVQSTRLCWNCLSSEHQAVGCPSKSKCRRCDKAHHTLLHLDQPSDQQKTSKGTSDQSSSTSIASNKSSSSSSISTHIATNSVQKSVKSVLLATAIIRVQNGLGQFVNLRALIDPGSQASFVSEAAVQLLRLPKQKASVSIYGVGATQTSASRASVNLRVSSVFCQTNHDILISAFVLATVTSILPPQQIKHQDWPHIRGLTLADPNFEQPGKIDIIIGADAYGQFILPDIRRGTCADPIAQRTIFGWILSGPATLENHHWSDIVSHHVSADEHTIDIDLRHFWEIEEVNAPTFNSDLERQCEEHFVRTYKRDSTGRFCLRLPLKCDESGHNELGESRSIAVGTMRAMERRFRTNKHLQGDYSDFMSEYLNLGHMTPISSTDPVHHNVVCYLPHHAVIKTQSTTTKTRVVFNASQPTSSGKSLNDIVLTGPKLQHDLVGILTRWRMYAVCLQADIEKMYRQINIDPRDTDLQRIVWRKNSSDTDFTDYRLTTVTYGTACAPFLAQRTLKQLAEEEKFDFPWACQVIANEFYVDDCLSGADTVSAAITLQSQLLTVLRRGGFSLRKWSSNRPEVVQHLPPDLIDKQSMYNFSDMEHKKTLGVYWKPDTDRFGFQLPVVDIKNYPTKRTILSDIAKLFDPLGWLAPTIISAKIFLQRLWLSGVTWDEQLPTALSDDWIDYHGQLHLLRTIQISRWIGVSATILDFELHGFCDASIKAYAAVIYSRIVTSCGDVEISILAAKTKVAPLKQNSLPRLELCAALLLTRLYTRLKPDIGINVPFNAWSDSTITLSWLRGEPIRWRTFVGNRVAQIQENTSVNQWRHVKSEDNPADCASRGIEASELVDHPLWWTGPPWLKLSPSDWPEQPAQFADSQAGEEEKSTVQSHVAINSRPWPLLEYFSSYTRLIRATAYWCRFVRNTRAVQNRMPKFDGSLTANELICARNATIRVVQRDDFYKEIDCIRSNRTLPRKSKLFKLTPFLDGDGLLRVFGRLQAATISFDQKHPVILSKTNKFTILIIDAAHRETMHGGPQLMLGHLRSKYWIIGARNLVRKHVRSCTICIRYRATTKSQLMGNLPSQRITPTRAFLHTGVDYAGPIIIRVSKGRGHKTDKAYIAIFVCFSTKAVHIELVSEYTSTAFIAAYRRFVSRRGHCSNLYSDCGTTFIGADKELRALHRKCMTDFRDVATLVANDGTSWHFNPPSAPHMGGLWEAAVKSAKHHLKRTIGDHMLTFEELSTVLAQVEACLNSRPLCDIGVEFHDGLVLTPGHFLIGAPIIGVPEPSIPDSGALRNRWQCTQRMVQQFWRQWSKSYLGQLVERSRWYKEVPSLQVGDVVIIKNELLPPAKWSLGRIEATHPGVDNLVRVVSVRCRGRLLQRPVVKLIHVLRDPVLSSSQPC